MRRPTVNRIALYFFYALCLPACDSSLDAGEPTSSRVRVAISCEATKVGDIEITCGRFKYSDAKNHYVSYAVIEPKISMRGENYNSDEPVIYLDGGPGWGGASTYENIDFWSYFYFSSNLNRPLILFNPVGTFGSTPYVKCDAWRTARLHAVNAGDKDTLKKFELLELEALKSCLGSVKNVGVYSSLSQAKILNELMTDLGYRKWHVWGASYGTRLALLAGQYAGAQSLILDSPYTFNQGLKSQDAKQYIYAFAQLFSIYELGQQGSQPKNIQPKDTLEKFLANALANILKHNIYLTVENSMASDRSKNQKLYYLLTPERLFELSFFSMYSAHSRQNFFKLIKNVAAIASNEERQELIDNGLVKNLVDNDLAPHFNVLTHSVVECADNARSSYKEVQNAIYISKDKAYSMLSKNQRQVADRVLTPVLNHPQDYLWLDLCEANQFADKLKVNNYSYPSIPTLVLAGGYDPVTPATGLNDFPDSVDTHKIVVGKAAHGILFKGHCEAKLVGTFLNSPRTINTHELSTFCANAP